MKYKKSWTQWNEIWPNEYGAGREKLKCKEALKTAQYEIIKICTGTCKVQN